MSPSHEADQTLFNLWLCLCSSVGQCGHGDTPCGSFGNEQCVKYTPHGFLRLVRDDKGRRRARAPAPEPVSAGMVPGPAAAPGLRPGAGLAAAPARAGPAPQAAPFLHKDADGSFTPLSGLVGRRQPDARYSRHETAQLSRRPSHRSPAARNTVAGPGKTCEATQGAVPPHRHDTAAEPGPDRRRPARTARPGWGRSPRRNASRPTEARGRFPATRMPPRVPGRPTTPPACDTTWPSPDGAAVIDTAGKPRDRRDAAHPAASAVRRVPLHRPPPGTRANRKAVPTGPVHGLMDRWAVGSRRRQPVAPCHACGPVCAARCRLPSPALESAVEPSFGAEYATSIL